VVTGSDTPASAGTVGLRLSGTGLVRIRSLSADPIPQQEEPPADTTAE